MPHPSTEILNMIDSPSTPAPTAMFTIRRVAGSIAGIAIFLAHVAASAAGAAGTDTAQASEKLSCESQPSGYDAQVMQCPLIATASPQRLRFKTNFSGSHDDTSVSMTATLNNAPLPCDKDSRMSLMGEDGDVSLHCNFSLAEKPGTKHVLRIRATWSHAQYTDFVFTRE